MVGEKKAREIWYLCRRYSVPGGGHGPGQRRACRTTSSTPRCRPGARECERSPTAIAIAKRSFNMDTAHQGGIAGLGMLALKMYYDTDESREGVNALKDKRKPEFKQIKYARTCQRPDCPR